MSDCASHSGIQAFKHSSINTVDNGYFSVGHGGQFLVVGDDDEGLVVLLAQAEEVLCFIGSSVMSITS